VQRNGKPTEKALVHHGEAGAHPPNPSSQPWSIHQQAQSFRSSHFCFISLSDIPEKVPSRFPSLGHLKSGIPPWAVIRLGLRNHLNGKTLNPTLGDELFESFISDSIK
jgi:hypothetical protein